MTVAIPPPNFVLPPLPELASSPGADRNRNSFKLHKLRALRRKARLKGGPQTDAAMSSAPLAVPASPSSSKRSRSRDSTRSAATSSIHTSTPFFTPSASAPSLLIPAPAEPSSQLDPDDPTPYPAFLRLSRPDIHQKYVDLEWEQRKRLLHGVQPQPDPEPKSAWARCTGDDVVSRNRYANVDPYQSNRVRLKVPDGLNDYINASPIELTTTRSKTALKYIATQGPKADTISHLWRMVWHETASPAVIVMLTQTHEANREKCFPYYPQTLTSPDLKINPDDEYGDGFVHDLKLVNLEQHDEARAQVRELDLTSEDTSETRKIWHLLFSGWPDFLVPEGSDRMAMLKLIDLSREKNLNNSTNPRIVHCSAGVGRSGTFIALDWLLQELEEGSLDEVGDDDDPVSTIVDTLRQQRMMMVQAEAQLVFIYDVLRERWRERWITKHPEEAERLGVTRNGEAEPQLKRQKSERSEASEQDEEDEDERAQLEAERMDSEVDFEKGAT